MDTLFFSTYFMTINSYIYILYPLFMVYSSFSTLGPGEYGLRDTWGAGRGATKISDANPKSDVEWAIHRAKNLPGPGAVSFVVCCCCCLLFVVCCLLFVVVLLFCCLLLVGLLRELELTYFFFCDSFSPCFVCLYHFNRLHVVSMLCKIN